jgi:cytochrome c1
MPTGLLNPLNAEELRDLIAYLVSAGDPNASVFQR